MWDGFRIEAYNVQNLSVAMPEFSTVYLLNSHLFIHVYAFLMQWFAYRNLLFKSDR